MPIRMPRARLAGTLALPPAGFLAPRGCQYAYSDASCAARGDARPPSGRIPRAEGLSKRLFGCLVRGSRGRSPSLRPDSSRQGLSICLFGSLVRGSRGRSPSLRPDSSCQGLSICRSGCLVRGSRGRSPSLRPDSSCRGRGICLLNLYKVDREYRKVFEESLADAFFAGGKIRLKNNYSVTRILNASLISNPSVAGVNTMRRSRSPW